MTLKELMKQIKEIHGILEDLPEAPPPGHPDTEGWATRADGVLDEVFGIVEEILGQEATQ